MTKVIILGEEPTEKKLKPIEATHCMQSDDLSMREWDMWNLTQYESISVFKLPKAHAYRNKDIDCLIISQNGIVFLGHFTDGIVE